MLCFPVCKFNHSHGHQYRPYRLNYINRNGAAERAGGGCLVRKSFDTVQTAVFHGFPSPFPIRAPHFTPIFFASLK